MHKFIFIIGAILLVLTGCNKTEESSNTLQIALWDEEAGDAVDAAIDSFNEKHPDVKVNVTYTPFAQYWTTLNTSIGGGSGPDLFWINAVNFYQYAEPGLIKDLEPFIEADEDFQKEDYYENMIELYSYEDDLFAAPFFVDAVGLFYNKEIFDEAGVDYPDETWTWEDIEKAGAELTNKKEDIYGYGAPVVSNQTGYYNLIHQAGGQIVSDDELHSGFGSDAALEALEFTKHLIDEGISPDVKTQIESELRQLFQSERLAMYPDMSPMVGETVEAMGDDVVDVAPLPSHKEKASITHGISWAMNDEVEDEALAWDLMKELTSKVGNEQIADSGYSIPAMKSTGDRWLKSIPDVNLEVFLKEQENGVPYPVSRNTAEWQRVEETEIQGAFLGQRTIPDALKVVSDEMNQILQEGSSNVEKGDR